MNVGIIEERQHLKIKQNILVANKQKPVKRRF